MADNHGGTDGRQTRFLFNLNGYHKELKRKEAAHTQTDRHTDRQTRGGTHRRTQAVRWTEMSRQR